MLKRRQIIVRHLRARASLTLAFSLLVAACAAAEAQSDEKPPLHGLNSNTSLGVFPQSQLDKGLLVTPGVHPVSVSAPLAEILNQVPARIEGQDSRRGKYQGWKVTVTNNSDRPLLFDGDAAVSLSLPGAAPAPCVSMEKLAQLSVLPEQSASFKKRLATDVKATAVAAVTIGWAQTIHDQKQGSGVVVAANGGRYGLDEQRREDQLRRFGKRVLWPGDSSSGIIYFAASVAAANAAGATGALPIKISIPVASYYDKADQGVLNLQ
ncbi:MAG: hypothetical protein KGS72_24875 [Cyanobacteria bacterium REEB67]|nr:hypothetical protein [Cyanobacteria bacterium REEB67]